MFRLDRTRTRREVLDGGGNPCGLVAERISVRAGFRVAGLGATYVRPVAVERGAEARPIADPVMIARLAGMLAVTLALIVKVIRT